MRVICLALFLLLTVNASAQSTNIVAIEYEHAGLTRLVLRPPNQKSDSQLSLTWHTHRKSDELATAQDIRSFDRHQLDAWPTSSELAKFRQWAQTNQFARFQTSFPSKPGPATYGSAFPTTLTVEIDGSRRSFKWTGDSEVPPEMASAVSGLMELAEHMKKTRQ
jgi:hypothetical protein